MSAVAAFDGRPLGTVPPRQVPEGAAARAGLWVVLACEMLLFGALLCAYAAMRALVPEAFHEGIGQTQADVGALSTVLLFSSSFFVLRAVRALQGGAWSTSAAWLVGSGALGLLFLVVKSAEVAQHLLNGAWPAGDSAFYLAHATGGLPGFYALYFVLMGTHAGHVLIGAVALVVTGGLVFRRRLPLRRLYFAENLAAYWLLVVVVWVFLWPLFYSIAG